MGAQPARMRKIYFIGMATCVCLMFSGCMAQQADVVRMNRDLNKKIARLDKSKKDLQQAVGEANEALDKTNSIIAQQREEIKTLLQARADLDDQMMTLKDGDLSEVRGAIDENRHQLETLTQQIEGLNQQVGQNQEEAKRRDETMQPIVEQIQGQVTEQEEVVTTQAEKMTEFRTSFLDFQQALATLRETMGQQDRLIQQANNQIGRVSRKQLTDNQSTTENFEEVKRSINSVVSALEKVSSTLANRLDEQDQKLIQVSPRMGSNAVTSSTPATIQPSAQAKEISQSVSQLRQDLNRLAKNLEPRGDTRRAAMNSTPPSQHTLPVPTDSYSQETSDFVHVPFTEEREAAAQRQPLADEAIREYGEHYALLRAGDVNGALNGFRRFHQRYPNSPLASNAQYWLGECYYAQRRFTQAILEFERVFNQYPSSEKVPAALLKIGYSNLELEKPTRARVIFRQLVRSYPKTPEAAKAYARLTEFERIKTPSPESGPLS